MSYDKFLIFYASQQGNAEYIAKSIFQQATERGFHCDCLVMDDYAKIDFPKQPVLVFVSSTTGDGDAPDNALKFWRYYRKLSKEGKDLLCGTKFTVLGIGDTNYSNFGAHPKKIHDKLCKLGAQTFYKMVIADEVEGLENVVDPWIEGLWSPLEKLVNISKQSSAISADKPVDIASDIDKVIREKLDRLEVTDSQKQVLQHGQESPGGDTVQWGYEIPFDEDIDSIDKLTNIAKFPAAKCKIGFMHENSESDSTLYWLRADYLSRNEPDKLKLGFTQAHPAVGYIKYTSCLTSKNAVKRTICLGIDIENLNWDYRPGDSLGILCPNNAGLVEAIMSKLRLKKNSVVKISPINEDQIDLIPSHLPVDKPIPIWDLFVYLVDITSFPRKAFFRSLAECANELRDKKRLLFICSRQGSQLYKKMMTYGPTLLDILLSFPSCDPSLEMLVDQLGALAPRYYSIASSPLTSKHTVDIAFNVVDYELKISDVQSFKRLGVCTPWLDELTGHVSYRTESTRNAHVVNHSKKMQIPIFPRPSKDFVAPNDLSCPIIMVGPGTGVAPFIGFIKHRKALMSMSWNQESESKFGESWLFYGCRNIEYDFLFRDFIEQTAGTKGVLDKCVVSTSRQQPVSDSKIPSISYYGKYVQDAMKEHGHEISRLLLEEDAKFFVCGDAVGMAKDVQKALADILVQHGNFNEITHAQNTIVEWMSKGKYVRDVWN